MGTNPLIFIEPDTILNESNITVADTPQFVKASRLSLVTGSLLIGYSTIAFFSQIFRLEIEGFTPIYVASMTGGVLFFVNIWCAYIALGDHPFPAETLLFFSLVTSHASLLLLASKAYLLCTAQYPSVAGQLHLALLLFLFLFSIFLSFVFFFLYRVSRRMRALIPTYFATTPVV